MRFAASSRTEIAREVCGFATWRRTCSHHSGTISVRGYFSIKEERMYGSPVRKIAIVSMLALAMVPAAHATVFAPGGSATPPQDFAATFIGATVADTGVQSIVATGGVYTANVRSIVVHDNTTGSLDFLYQVLKTG